MPKALSNAYLKQIQDLVTAAPQGPWPVEPTDDGRLPDQVGPICFLETWSDADRLPVIEFISRAREALPALLGEIARQRDVIRALQQRVQRLEFANGTRHTDTTRDTAQEAAS